MIKPRTIETITKEIYTSLKTTVADRVKIGKLLNEARGFFKSKKSYGNWVSGNFPDQFDPKTLNNYRQLAKCFSENLPKNIPPSGLYEIAAPKNDDIRDRVLEKLGSEKVSLQDVKDAIAQVRSDDEAEKDAFDMAEKIGEIIKRDSHTIFLTIIEDVGKDTVLKWVGELDQTEQEKAA